jgi:hypothetical protein
MKTKTLAPESSNDLKDADATGTDSTTGNASSTLAGAESSNQVPVARFCA